MRSRVPAAMIVALAATTLIALPSSAPTAVRNSAGTIVVSGGALIDGTGREPLSGAMIVVREGRIAEVTVGGAPGLRAGTEAIDARGKWLVPGLIDMHVHYHRLAAEAQQPAKVFRIGILGTYPPTTPEFAHLWDAFAQGLRGLGYIEGQSLVVERRLMEEKAERLPELAAELVRLNVSVIVAGGQPPPVAAKRTTATIPIVMTNFSDPVGLGLVTSLSRPGGNITGLAFLAVELVGKQLQLLREAVLKVARVAFLTNPDNPGAALQRKDAETTARSLGLQLQALEAQRPDELAREFAAMTRESPGRRTARADRVIEYAMCLPGTVDPSGPKGK